MVVFCFRARLKKSSRYGYEGHDDVHLNLNVRVHRAYL
jgi:hypothetical protein